VLIEWAGDRTKRLQRSLTTRLRAPRFRKLTDGLLTLLVHAAPTIARLKCALPTSCVPAVVHVIGDSHACFFSGNDRIEHPWPEPSDDRIDLFRTYWLGPALAYNLPHLHTTVRAREKLLLALAYGRVPPRGMVMLTFGEIDCRYHLLRQAQLQHRDVEGLVHECVQRYLSVVREIRGFGFRPLVWNVVPTGQPRSVMESNTDLPFWGMASQRNAVTRQFNEAMAVALIGDDVPIVSIFDDLLGPDGLPLRDAYYLDAVHLNQKAMPLATVAVSKALGCWGINDPKPKVSS
jgi:hypothetical protein